MLEWNLSRRFLISKKRGRFLSLAGLVAVAGVAFGTASWLVSFAVIEGFQREYKKAVLNFNSHLVLMRADEIDKPGELGASLSSYITHGALKGTASFIYREGMVVSGSKVKGIVIKGVDFPEYRKLSRIDMEPYPEREGDNVARLPALWLGEKLAQELGVNDENRNLRILFPQGLSPEDAGVKNSRRFFVKGVFRSGLYEYDSSFAFIDLAQANTFFETNGRVSGLEIWLEDPDRAEDWAEVLRKDFEFPFVVMTWRELNEGIFRALDLEKIIFFILMAVLMVVATLNILGTLVMLVLDKRKEAAILRAMGLSWKRLRTIFLFNGLFIGSVGIFLGVCLALGAIFVLGQWHPIALAPEVYFIERVPVVYSWKNFAFVAAAAFGIILIGCAAALRRVSRMNLLHTLLEGSGS